MKKIFLLLLLILFSCSRSVQEDTTSSTSAEYFFKITYDGKVYNIKGSVAPGFIAQLSYNNYCIAFAKDSFVEFLLDDKKESSYITGDKIWGELSFDINKVGNNIPATFYTDIPGFHEFSEIKPTSTNYNVYSKLFNNKITIKVTDLGTKSEYSLTSGCKYGKPIKGIYDGTIYIWNGNSINPVFTAKKLTIEFAALRDPFF